MPSYQVDKKKNIISYDGKIFNLAEVRSILKSKNIEMFKTISCPNEIKFVLTEEAKSILILLAEKK